MVTGEGRLSLQAEYLSSFQTFPQKEQVLPDNSETPVIQPLSQNSIPPRVVSHGHEAPPDQLKIRLDSIDRAAMATMQYIQGMQASNPSDSDLVGVPGPSDSTGPSDHILDGFIFDGLPLKLAEKLKGHIRLDGNVPSACVAKSNVENTSRRRWIHTKSKEQLKLHVHLLHPIWKDGKPRKVIWVHGDSQGDNIIRYSSNHKDKGYSTWKIWHGFSELGLGVSIDSKGFEKRASIRQMAEDEESSESEESWRATPSPLPARRKSRANTSSSADTASIPFSPSSLAEGTGRKRAISISDSDDGHRPPSGKPAGRGLEKQTEQLSQVASEITQEKNLANTQGSGIHIKHASPKYALGVSAQCAPGPSSRRNQSSSDQTATADISETPGTGNADVAGPPANPVEDSSNVILTNTTQFPPHMRDNIVFKFTPWHVALPEYDTMKYIYCNTLEKLSFHAEYAKIWHPKKWKVLRLSIAGQNENWATMIVLQSGFIDPIVPRERFRRFIESIATAACWSNVNGTLVGQCVILVKQC